jgi:hypothetical protein
MPDFYFHLRVGGGGHERSFVRLLGGEVHWLCALFALDGTFVLRERRGLFYTSVGVCFTRAVGLYLFGTV